MFETMPAAIIGALLLALCSAVAIVVRIARQPRGDPLLLRRVPPASPRHDTGASAAIVEGGERRAEQIADASTSETDAATLARLRRGRR